MSFTSATMNSVIEPVLTAVTSYASSVPISTAVTATVVCGVAAVSFGVPSVRRAIQKQFKKFTVPKPVQDSAGGSAQDSHARSEQHNEDPVPGCRTLRATPPGVHVMDHEGPMSRTGPYRSASDTSSPQTAATAERLRSSTVEAVSAPGLARDSDSGSSSTGPDSGSNTPRGDRRRRRNHHHRDTMQSTNRADSSSGNTSGNSWLVLPPTTNGTAGRTSSRRDNTHGAIFERLAQSVLSQRRPDETSTFIAHAQNAGSSMTKLRRKFKGDQ